MDLFKSLGIRTEESSLIDMKADDTAIAKSIETGGFEFARPGQTDSFRENLFKSLVAIYSPFPELPQSSAEHDENGDNFGAEHAKGGHGEEYQEGGEEHDYKAAPIDRITDADDEEAPLTAFRLAASVKARPKQANAKKSMSQEDLLRKALDEIIEKGDEKEDVELAEKVEAIVDKHQEKVEKSGAGPGSRGGKVVGTTSSGKPIYANANHKEHKGFDAKDHHEAYAAHYRLGQQDGADREHHGKQQAAHKTKWQAHEELGAKIPSFSDSCSKVKLTGDIKKSSLDEVFDLIKGKPNMVPLLKPGGKAPKPKKDKIESQIEREAAKEVEKSDDSIIQVVPEKKKSPKALANLHENSPQVAEKRKSNASKSFIKSFGQGGLVFDFGSVTGNRIADYTNSILARNSDPIQVATAVYQQQQYDKALTEYVTKGEKEFMSKSTEFGDVQKDWGKQLEKSMDEQVSDAFKAGVFDEKAPAVRNDFNKTEITLGGEVIKATSATDAALIEMMKSAQAVETEGGFVADATHNGAIKITAGDPLPEI